jgi:hypothetical protein
MRRLIFKFFWTLSLIFNMHLIFLSWGSKSVQIFHFVLNLIWGCSKCVRICSIWVLDVAGTALFRFWTEADESTVLSLCSKPIYSNSSNFQDANRAILTHLEQPQIRFEKIENLNTFWASALELKMPVKIKGRFWKFLNIRHLMPISSPNYTTFRLF